eukprot:TRINITY_DN1669_c0_g1_i1.p2 TRINITY_DN1669_c0_g1~~TRINITY_DN1669_c0_g1_i1.p2  ORF type:complete len:111 (+),score=45.67 TRINITY_DN1669_c0_g1_i1:77-409(+)
MDLVNWLLGRRPEQEKKANGAPMHTDFAERQFEGFAEQKAEETLTGEPTVNGSCEPVPKTGGQRHLPPDLTIVPLHPDAARMRAAIPEAKEARNFFFRRLWGAFFSVHDH